MDRIQVSSSNILSVGYDPSSALLEIEFLQGGIYQYLAVPEHIYQELMGAPSKGQYFHQHIRNSFATMKIS